MAVGHAAEEKQVGDVGGREQERGGVGGHGDGNGQPARGQAVTAGGLQGDGHGGHNGDVEVDQSAQQRRQDQDPGSRGNNPGAAGRDEHAGQGPERAEPPGERRGEDNRGQGGERPGGGGCCGGCGLRRQRGGDDCQEEAAGPDGGTERIVR